MQEIIVHSQSARCDGLQAAKMLAKIPSIDRVVLAGPWIDGECIDYLTMKQEIDELVVVCPNKLAPLTTNRLINGVKVYVELEGTTSYKLSHEFIDKCLDGRVK